MGFVHFLFPVFGKSIDMLNLQKNIKSIKEYSMFFYIVYEVKRRLLFLARRKQKRKKAFVL